MTDAVQELELTILSNMIQRMPVYMSLSAYPSDIMDTPDLSLWFESVKECYASKGACDMMSIMGSMNNAGNVAVYGKWLSRVSAAPLCIATIDQHIDTLVGMYRKRIIDRACRRAIEMPTADAANAIIAEGMELAEMGGKDSGSHIQDIAGTGLSQLTISEELQPTGFLPLDKVIRGFGKGELIIIGGYAKAGKTTLALQLSFEMSAHSRVNYYSLEMTRPEVFRKVLSRKSVVMTDDMATGRMSDVTKDKLNRTMDVFKSGKYNFKIIDDLYHLDEILSHARLSWMRDGMTAMVIDYLQLCETSNIKGEQRYLTVGKMTRRLKQFAQQTGIRVIVLSQMTGDENEKPTGQNFRESGNIFMDCNIPLITWHDKKNNRSVLILDRNRRTAAADIDVSFDGMYSRFIDNTAPTKSWTEADV